MRILASLALTLMLVAGAQAADGPKPSSVVPSIVRGPDHVLIWSVDFTAAKAVMARLGFNVRDGASYEDAIGSATVTFGDWTLIELFHVFDAAKITSAQAKTELAFVKDGPGLQSFALEVRSADEALRDLRAAGFDMADIVPDTFDPDGPAGPLPAEPADWRDFHFRTSPVTGAEVFFIEYPPAAAAETAEQKQRFLARTTHANTALRLTAVWLLVANPDTEAAAYRRMGLRTERVSDLPGLSAPGWVVHVGGGRIVLAGPQQPAGLPYRPTRGVPRVLGISLEVGNLEKASEFARSIDPAEQIYGGLLGRSVRVSTEAELGVFIEFHRQGAAF